jgi:hypothetical protein
LFPQFLDLLGEVHQLDPLGRLLQNNLGGPDLCARLAARQVAVQGQDRHDGGLLEPADDPLVYPAAGLAVLPVKVRVL